MIFPAAFCNITSDFGSGAVIRANSDLNCQGVLVLVLKKFSTYYSMNNLTFCSSPTFCFHIITQIYIQEKIEGTNDFC
jgi:hypothetical protein